jgi:hypothetical protein
VESLFSPAADLVLSALLVGYRQLRSQQLLPIQLDEGELPRPTTPDGDLASIAKTLFAWPLNHECVSTNLLSAARVAAVGTTLANASASMASPSSIVVFKPR